MKNIAKALLDAQRKIENAHKDSKNPHFNSNFASLESVLDAVKPIANECGLVIAQTGGKDLEGHFIETKLLHESGEEINSKVYLVLDKNNMQGLGSAITYARRYSLAALFAIGQDDDDGNSASGGKQNQGTHGTTQQNKATEKQAQKSNGFGPRTTNNTSQFGG